MKKYALILFLFAWALAETDPALAAEMQELADAALAGTIAIHVPFDQAIVQPDFRPAVLDSVNALQDQGDKIAEAAGALGLSVNTDLPAGHVQWDNLTISWQLKGLY